jgi:peroxiredoxin
MIELGQLEANHAEFDSKNVRIVVVSLESREDAAKTHEEFPHLTAVADKDRQLIVAAGALHPHAAPDGGDAAAPTTVLIDRTGVVRWVFRPDRYLGRISPDDLLAAVVRELH